MIVQLCQRNSCSLSDQVREKIWFSLFDEVMRPIRGLIIDPSIEAALLSAGSVEETEDERVIRQRLDETREFFKGLGSYIINSMVGYLSLTTIIDRMICDPLYGASNFGDIKELMLKMLEMCAYEQTLLDKTSSLVSRDVYTKMLIYKRLAAKSFSSYTNFCQYCSRPLDLAAKSADTLSINSSMSTNQQRLLSLNTNIISPSIDLPNADSSSRLIASTGLDLDSKMAIAIYNCGHSFHLSCLEIMQTPMASTNASNCVQTCPICNSSSTSSSRAGLQQHSSSSRLKSKYAKKKSLAGSSSAANLKDLARDEQQLDAISQSTF